MLLVGSYDYSPRDEDGRKTLGFRKNDVLMFLDVHQTDPNWLQVVDRKGYIGYIPKNYVQMSEEDSRDDVLEFVLEAMLKARRENLDSIEKLEYMKEHVIRIEYREFQTRLLLKALTYHSEDTAEISDATTYDVYKDMATPFESENVGSQSKKSPGNGSNSSFCSLKSEKTCNSIKSAPVNLISKIPAAVTPIIKDCGRDVSKNASVKQLISSRASRSCPLGPKNAIREPPEEIAKVDKYASGDNKCKPTYSSNRNTILSSSSRQSGKTVRESSKTRIPIRTPISKSQRLTQRNTQSLQLSHQEPFHSSSGNFQELKVQGISCERMAARLITMVQESGGLDIKQSETVVHRVLHHVQENFNPGMPEKVRSVLQVFEKASTTGSLQNYNGACKNVLEILTFLTSVEKLNFHNESDNNYNGALIEDESVILDKLDQLQDELLKLDPKLLKLTMEVSHYHSLHDLVLLYQLESRSSIKNKLLEIFSMIATMDNTGRSVLLRSSLPIELSKEMYGNEGSPRKLSRIAGVLISLMSGGEYMPETHFNQLGIKFLTFILTFLEEPEQGEADEKAKADLSNVLLAYNLQFSSNNENYLIKTLAGRSPARYLIEVLMYLFENEVDPIKSGSESSDLVAQSVFKLMKDMFSCRITAEHFHSAEMKMIIDLMTQSLSVLGPGDKRRTEYLELMWLLLRNRSFHYRISDIRQSFVSILLEEDPLSIPDQRIIRGISKEFPAVFKTGNKIAFGNPKSALDDQIPFKNI